MKTCYFILFLLIGIHGYAQEIVPSDLPNATQKPCWNVDMECSSILE